MKRLENLVGHLTTSQQELTLLEFENDGVAILTLNDQQRMNAMSVEMRNSIISQIQKIEENSNAKVILLKSSSAKAFCVGANVKDFYGYMKVRPGVYSDPFKAFIDSIRNCKLPIVVAINGYCLGGGMEIAQFCDILVASEDAKLGQPEIKIGVIPGWGGTQNLFNFTSKTNASYMALTGEFISASKAKELGFVTEVFPNDKLHEEALKICKKISVNTRESIIHCKAALKASFSPSEQNLNLERILFFSLYGLDSTKEKLDDFLTKKK